MKATLETLALIRAADESTVNANKAGVKAVMALIRENLDQKFPHGSAVELAALLKDGKVATHTAKRYADLTAMAVKAIAHQATLAASKAKVSEKAAAKSASIEASLATLAGLSNMAKIRQWAKDSGPKAKEKAKEKATVEAPAEAPAEAPVEAPTAPNIEAMGQMREIREVLAMINAGQVTAGEGLATIATVAGIQLASVPKAPAGKAGTKDKTKPVPKAV